MKVAMTTICWYKKYSLYAALWSFVWMTFGVDLAVALAPPSSSRTMTVCKSEATLAAATTTAATTISSRRTAIGWISTAAATTLHPFGAALAAADSPVAPPTRMPDQFNVDDFLKTGMVMNPMGVSGQAGKSKPETGVIFRDGSEVNRDSRTGDVLAEILLKPISGNDKIPVLASFVSPWPLASGTVFDVECRNVQTGDGTFLTVTPPIPNGISSIESLPDAFIVDALIGPTGRFSSYGTPTDVKFKRTQSSSKANDDSYRSIDLSFSTLSQSTQTEIPRRARIVATIPSGTSQAVLLVGSSSAIRWNKGASTADLQAIADSFRAVPAPNTTLRVRAKERRADRSL